MATTTVCLFDLDGVIRHWDAGRAARAEDAAGLARGSLSAAFEIPEYRAGVLGHVSFEDWCAATVETLTATWGSSSATRAVRYWHASRGQLDDRVVEIVRALRTQTRVALLSNAHDCLRSDLRVLGLDGAFDEVICSAEVQLAKPNPAIYFHAAATLGKDPSDCFFTDDLPENVAGAREAGMDAQLFTGVSGLVEALAARDFDVPVQE